MRRLFEARRLLEEIRYLLLEMGLHRKIWIYQVFIKPLEGWLIFVNILQRFEILIWSKMQKRNLKQDKFYLTQN